MNIPPFCCGRYGGENQMRLKLSYRSLFIAVFYVSVLLVQLYLWPVCEDEDSTSLMDDLERKDDHLEFGPLPSNLLDPPMWSRGDREHLIGQCGLWQKPYTHMHRAMLAGDLPPSYLIYTTGQGFPPIIQGIPQALKGIATVFMLAILTERAFILDWKSPTGFSHILVPHYIDWRFDARFVNELDPIHKIHDIGSASWYTTQNRSIHFYTETNFNTYFSSEREAIQAHSFDFTYALLRNSYFRKKLREYGLESVKCRLCCFWHYLFKHSVSFSRTVTSVAKKKFQLTPKRDLIFIDISFSQERLSKRLLTQQMTNVFNCVERIVKVLHNPICVVASNSYFVFEEAPKMSSCVRTGNGLFFTRERYQIELRRLTGNSTKRHDDILSPASSMVIPKTEHNALLYYFVGYYLQLNSTVLMRSKRSPYSETMAAVRHFYYPSGRYVAYPDDGLGGRCKLERLGVGHV